MPVLAKLAATVPGLELRVILRDQHPEVMDRYLTNGSRSIPIVIALDEQFRELGHWGPRPRELQAWVMANRLDDAQGRAVSAGAAVVRARSRRDDAARGAGGGGGGPKVEQ